MSRNQAEMAAWIAVVQAEYREIPGMSLTKRQVQRLWGFDAPTCDALVDFLETTRFLRRTAKDTYVLRDALERSGS